MSLERGGLSYKNGRDAHRKFQIKPPKETNPGVTQVFLTPKRDHIKTQRTKKYDDF